jgi:hypothetical protein
VTLYPVEEMPIDGENMESLYQLLASLLNLKTFLLSLLGGNDQPDQIPEEVIGELLQSLPQSVINLEIVTYGRVEPNDQDFPPDPHLCFALVDFSYNWNRFGYLMRPLGA